MTACISHRGPDDEGIWVDDAIGIGFGFRRLAIQDLSPSGHQPMQSSTGRYVLVFNGEVYNFVELRQELESLGLRFRGHSDTEVLLAAFERWGIRHAVRRFVGMFAMAVWDRRDRRLTLIRDRLGIKPLYVFHGPGLILFGSELRSLRTSRLFTAELDPEAVQLYLRYLFVPAPATIYRDTIKLPPGHLLEVENPAQGRFDPEPYWSLDRVIQEGRDRPFTGQPQEAVEALDELLRDAVDMRLRSDVPVGALLSGGIDSSTIVALMAREGRRVRTYTVGFDVAEHDESQQARAIANHLGTDHTELMLTGSAALDLIPRLPSIVDEPLGDPSLVPTYLVSSLARRDVTVALSGDGGDELFAGYNRYLQGRRLMQGLQSVPAAARRAVSGALSRISTQRWNAFAGPITGNRVRLVGEKIAKLVSASAQSTPAAVYADLLATWPDAHEVMPGFQAKDAIVDELERVSTYVEPGSISWMMAADQRHYLPDDLLAKVDRASMAVSLEVRVPLLDHRVVEFSWSLPEDLKIRDGRSKWLLRQVLSRYVSAELVDRRKVGFSVPVAEWLRGPLREWASDLLLVTPLDDLHVDRRRVEQLWSRFLSGHGQLALGLWSLALLQAWRTTAPAPLQTTAGVGR